MTEKSVILATAGYDHTVKFWQAPTGNCQRSIPHIESQVNCLEISPDKTYLAAGGNPLVRLYECHTANAAPFSTFTGHTNNVTCVGFPKTGKWLFSGSEDGMVRVWDVRSPGSQREIKLKSPVTSAVVLPNQAEILCGDEDGNVRIFDLNKGECVCEMTPDGKTPIRSVTVAADGSVMAAGNNKGQVYIWRLGAQRGGPIELMHKVEAHSAYLLKCVMSPDSKALATTSADKTVKLWDAERNFALDKTLSAHTAWVWDCAFSADSAYIVSASSDRTAKLWDTKSGDIIIDYKQHTKAVTCVALNDS